MLNQGGKINFYYSQRFIIFTIINLKTKHYDNHNRNQVR